MKRSSKRIFTTHVGRLQRPEKLTNAMEALPGGRPADPVFAAQLKTAVADVVRQQADAGVDIVNDSEFGKLSRNSYLNGRNSRSSIANSKAAVHTTIARRDGMRPWVWSGPAPGR